MDSTSPPTSRTLAVAVATVVAVCLAACGGDPSSIAEITFQARAESADRVLVETIRADGSQRRSPFTDLPSDVQRHADWSPDGTRMVFTAADDQDTDDLWIANADGSAARKVVECTSPCLGTDEAAWSPDGRNVVFWRLVQPDAVVTSTLELLDVARGTTSVITTAAPRTVLLAPRWSPDGGRLVVEWLQLSGTAYDADPTGDIVGIIDLSDVAAGVRPLTDPARYANNPDWSASGEFIVYAARVGGDTTFQDLYLSAPDGTGERRLTHLAADGDMAVQPTFTPDSKQVLFVRKPGGGARALLAAVDVAGSAVRPAAGTVDVEGEHPRMRPGT